MTRSEALDKAKTTKEKAALLLSLLCEDTEDEDCPHRCDDCQAKIEAFLEEQV